MKINLDSFSRVARKTEKGTDDCPDTLVGKLDCHGDQTLFASLHTNLQTYLPKEPVEWKRSYGRARTVIVEAVFVPFSTQIIPNENARSSLIGQPCFHVFWTDCDSDLYKAGVKEEISNWVAALKTRGVSDWLIVVVQTDERRNKLLPRSSVIDKVKSDFCSKNSERCFQLVEPMKTELRTLESWQNLTVRLRHLVLQSFTKHINKFEDNMRSQRERRNEPGWSFSQYFMLQEELAFTFEMFGLYEESLVQYDELDALFTQFVVNHAAGETAQWLNSSFSHDIKRWSGLDLTQLMNQYLRTLIQENGASLLDFRDYLFSRQCAMLFMLYRPWEVAQRSIPFMHNCLQELAILDLSLPPGAVSSWVFLSCLAVMDACERFADSAQVENYSLYTASLWEYARQKLLDLGELCGLMPDCTTTSRHLNLVVNILVGVDGGAKMDGAEIGPNERLSAALSSKESFQKSYMELAELAMGTFKHIGRYRSARLIGKDLADFYMRLREYAKAEAFLSDAYKTYKMEGWEQLADHTRVDIAYCQKLQRCELKYVKSCCQLASSQTMNTERRREFGEEFLRVSEETIDDSSPLRLLPVFTLKRVHLLHHKVVIQSDMIITLELYNNTLHVLPARNIRVCYRAWTDSDTVTRSRGSSVTSQLSIESNILQHQLTNIPIDTPRSSKTSETQSQVGVMYSEVGKFYSQSLPKEKELHKEDFSLFLGCDQVDLEPGLNTLELKGKANQPGVYRINQLCVAVNNLEFLHNFSSERLKITILCDKPAVTLLPRTEKVYSGLPQTLVLQLTTGSYPVPAGGTLRLSSRLDASIDGHGQTINFQAVEAYQSLEFSVLVLAPLSQPMEESHKFNVECDWLEDGKTEYDVTFHNLLHLHYQLLTASQGRKYVRVDVKNMFPDQHLQLKAHQLQFCDVTADQATLKLLNPVEQQVSLCGGLCASYVWQLETEKSSCLPLPCRFSIQYSANNNQHTATSEHQFAVQNYKTLYTVKSEIMPTSDHECQAGNFCRLRVSVDRQTNQVDELMYRILVDDQTWALSGKITGVLTPDQSEVCLDVMPLIGGYLPLPVMELQRLQATPDGATDDGAAGDAAPDDVTVPFARGEVYNVSLASQVRVLPSVSKGGVEVKVRG